MDVINDRLLAAQAKRERKAVKRMNDAAKTASNYHPVLQHHLSMRTIFAVARVAGAELARRNQGRSDGA